LNSNLKHGNTQDKQSLAKLAEAGEAGQQLRIANIAVAAQYLGLSESNLKLVSPASPASSEFCQ